MTTLTAAEEKWLKKLQKVLNECPSERFGSYTTGDSDINLFDVMVRDAWDDANPNAQLDAWPEMQVTGAYLATVTMPFAVESRA
jgi:hypothetical protein